MVGVMNVRKCGTCHFAEIVGQDLSKRICHGNPPTAAQVVLPPRQAGGFPEVTIRSVRPIVSVTDKECALYRGKNAEDIQQDNSAVNELKAMASGGVTDTKQ
jgi:hypothetical protein